MLGFITKVTAVRVAAVSNPAAAKPIREQVRILNGIPMALELQKVRTPSGAPKGEDPLEF